RSGSRASAPSRCSSAGSATTGSSPAGAVEVLRRSRENGAERGDSMTPEPRTHHLGASRRTAIALVLVGAVAVGAAAAATARPNAGAGRVFYLGLVAGQCAEGKVSASVKTLLVVPCSNGQHNLEVYARVHGGWPGAQI